MDPVALRLFGPTRLHADGAARDLGGPRRRAVLAYLVLHRGSAVPAERIIADVWGPDAAPGARRSLQTSVSALRGVLAPRGDGPTITYGSGGYRLELGRAWVDVDRFEAAAARAVRDVDASAAAEALALWSGEPFQEFRDQDWAGLARESLRERYRGALLVHVDDLLGSGRHEEALRTVAHEIAATPLDEGLWERRLLALYRSGRQTEALEAYAEIEETLRSELGLDPGAGLAELQRRILLHDPTLAGPGGPTHAVPASISTFVGRSAELACAEDLAAEHRLLTITGPGGVGKTRLAIELAHGWRGSVPGGVFFVDLTAVAGPERVPDEIAGLVGVDRPAGDALGHLCAHLGPTPTVMVLDNAEHLREVVATTVRSLLERAPGLRIVVTSRVPLGVTGEVAWGLPPLDLPREGDDVVGATNRDAVALFARRAGEVRPAFRVGAANVAAVGRIVRRLDGLPLAIEIAAGRLRSMGVSDIEARLDRDLGGLRSDDPTVSDRHRTLTGLLAWSTDLLEPPAARAFARLAVAPGSFDLDAATVVCGTDRQTTLEHLDILVQHSLLGLEPAGHSVRYRMLEVVRDHARELLTRSGERAEAERALLDWALELAREMVTGLRGAEGGAWVERLTAEQAGFRAALEAGLAHDPGRGLRLATQLVRFWWANAGETDVPGRRSLPTLHEGIDWLERLLAAGGAEVALRVRAAGEIALGFLRGVVGEGAAAREVLLNARDAMVAAGEDRLAGWASLYLGSAAWGEGATTAGAHFRDAADRFTASGDREGLSAAALLEYAFRLRSQGPDAAEDALRRFLRHTEGVETGTPATYRAGVLALDALARGDAVRAREALLGAISANRSATDPATTAILLGICAWHAALTDDVATAAVLVVMAEEVEARHGLHFRQAGFARELTREALGDRWSRVEATAREEARGLPVRAALEAWVRS